MHALAAALALGLAGCASYYSTGMGGYVQHRTSPTMLWSEPGAPGAEMAPDRKVSEQDCAAPIASATANLKCR